MNEQSGIEINTPALPKTGGAIQSIGKGWGAVGTDGGASLNIGLPISPGRGFAPALSLDYRSGVGNSPFSIGWALNTNAITLRTTKGVPTYDGNDQVVGPGGDVWMPERDHNGDVTSREVTEYKGTPLGDTFFVVRHWPRVEGGFDLIEHWYSTADPAGFWLIHGTDGSLHIYGKTTNSRRADPNEPAHVGVWMICESLNTRGEHIVFEYKEETELPAPPQNRDYRAQRYLRCVHYGNEKAHPHLYAWIADSWKAQHWHFHLVFDYGERSTDLEQVPTFDEQVPWPERGDPFWNYAYGFELGTRRLCRQVLMFHHFIKELGREPVLVQRLLLDHRMDSLGYHHLTAAHIQAYDSLGQVESRPPMEFSYNPFKLDPLHPGWTRLPDMPGLNDGQHYQLVDLYGEGMPGVLCREDNTWHYREPLRCETGGDDVYYSDWQQLPHIPPADSSKPIHQSLTDLTGDGKLDWVVAMPGMCGFFTLDPDRNWSNFVPFDAFPGEFFHPMAKMADLVGDGLSDMALIGTRSVRLYANRREGGFASGIDVPHDDDDLPLLSNTPTELVAFADMRGSGQAQLVRIRHNEVKCWPNLGHGRFGKGFVLCSLPFAYDTFNAAQVLLADLDGSGAVDLIYLMPDHFQVFMNHAGNGYEPKADEELSWPDGVRYDALCQVSTADLQGLGCSSLILTVPHMSPRHWRYDFVNAKPYLVNATCNNMGASSRVTYRSSAQYWQDEKLEQRKKGIKNPVCQLPFAMHLVCQQTQIDEITGNRLTQAFNYRGGFYDRHEREFRGFRLLEQTDTEATPAERATEGFTAPIRSMSYFHIGDTIDQQRNGYYQGDSQAPSLKPTLLQQYHFNDRAAQLLTAPDEDTQREIARCLSGRLLRSEVYAADDDPATAVPYVVTESRALVWVLRPKGEYQPYAVLQVLELETRSYHYEPQIPDDPLCQHSLNLEWDQYGRVTHGVTIHCARRKVPGDTPPFTDEHEQRYWKDAHDEAQQRWYITQNKACHIHHLGEDIANLEAWSLDLPYQQRSNAMVLEKTELSAGQINHENVLEWCKDGGPWAEKTVLAGLSMQLYMDPATQQPLAPGKATFEGLTAHTVTAELDKAALSAYDKLKNPEGEMPFNLKEKLESVGYHIMELFLPEVAKESVEDREDAKNYLWAVHKSFPVYDDPERFYNVKKFRETQSHGETAVVYDAYSILTKSVTLPDGCTTRILDIDYRTFLPAAIEDANRNIQEARYSAFGEPLVTSVHGTELGVPVGFDLLESYVPQDRDPAIAINDKKTAIGRFASASFWDTFCWMGRISRTAPPSPDWLTWARTNGFVLPSGHICERARQHLEGVETLVGNEQILRQQIDATHREPPYAIVLLSDRYVTDIDFDERKIRVSITCMDGFGQVLQTKQEVEPGKSWRVDEKGCLILGPDGKPIEEEVPRRWRVSEPVEYNNKGEKVRIYRPYFADWWGYINDQSMRQHAFHDKQFYDAAGRPTKTILARKMLQGNPAELKPLRREIWYWIWCTVAFDENDLFDPPPDATRRTNRTLH
ncbi:insecticide toxin TcdB-like protein [Pseudomonas sp. SJZ080]|uniref:SpvB/TcaC N-terminal domain-containing protein n=1 Tax=Pseudomonas sp. SJZ080 TaxID=2572888 RepID=UPI0011991F24|nr:SpvB/TcaC N-terminal domain-containing protein [Pseudomonas sp. SJZ080]TWC55256.1 insecticide toxin TcdB-like protein [Pseudomonas sp. SJZ080]